MKIIKVILLTIYTLTLMSIFYGIIYIGNHGIAPYTNSVMGNTFSIVCITLIIVYEFYPLMLAVLEAEEDSE